ncbi:MAG TPA: helix-turn-helix domain-containing protein [Methanospirillum sp.]|nr:helix-turn-helix domain-containing protein [Methanospirillum sp.]
MPAHDHIIPDPHEILSRLESERERVKQLKGNILKELSDVESSLDSLSRSVLQVLEASHAQISSTKQVMPPLQFLDDVEDERLKETLSVLLHYPEKEASAEDMAKALGKHRSTLSQYLNDLVDMKKVSKRRKGHEVFFAIQYSQTASHEKRCLVENENVGEPMKESHDQESYGSSSVSVGKK